MVAEGRGGYKLLWGVRRQRQCDLEALLDALLRLSQLSADLPGIIEFDINPPVACEEVQGKIAIHMRLMLE